MSKIPEVFAIFEQKLAHVLSFTVVPLKSKDLKNALEEILTYFSGIVERASKAESRIAELEAENAELKERVAMLDITAVFKSLGEMGYIERTNKLHTLIAEIEAECEQLRLGIHDETVPEKYEENVAKLQKEFSMRFENESPVEFYRTIRSGQYPQPPEVQE